MPQRTSAIPTESPFQLSLTSNFGMSTRGPSVWVPTSISARVTKSHGSLAISPILSKLELNLKTPSVGIKLGVGFIAYSPERLAGYTVEPDVSVPMASGQKPEAMDTADPDEEPPAIFHNLALSYFVPMILTYWLFVFGKTITAVW